MTEGVAQDGKASSMLQDMGKVPAARPHTSKMAFASISSGEPAAVGSNSKRGFCLRLARDPRGGGTRDKRMLSDRDAVGGRIATLDVGRTVEESGKHNDVAR